MRVPWTARRSNQSILKEINPGVSLEGMMLKLKLQYFMMLKLKLQYFGHLMRRVDLLEKTLMLGWIGGRRRRGRLRMRWLDGITSIESVMPSSHLILCRPLLLLPPIHPSIRVFSNGVHSITSSAAAKSLQLCPTLCNPIDGSPLGSAVPGILQARTLEWVTISFSNA